MAALRNSRHDARRDWLPFLNTYRTMCLAPRPEFWRVLEQVREMRLAATDASLGDEAPCKA